MQKYIAVKIVKAAPATKAEVYDEQKRPYEGDGQEPGYRVCYPGNPGAPYESWCPKDVFEAANRPCDGMTFGLAIEAMKKGKRVARRGWNGKGMWLCIPLVDGPKEVPAQGIWGKPNAEYAEQNGGTVKVMPYITMKTADGAIVMGWLASQTDMLSDDWEILED